VSKKKLFKTVTPEEVLLVEKRIELVPDFFYFCSKSWSPCAGNNFMTILRLECLKLCFHWQKLARLRLRKGQSLLTFLGHLGRCDRDKIISINVMLPKVAKASTVTLLSWQLHVTVADGYANKRRQCKWSIIFNRYSWQGNSVFKYDLGSAKVYGRKPRTCVGQVFNSKWNSFVVM